MDHGFGVFDFGFVVSHQATVLHTPAEGALDDPAFAQHFEATLVLEARHDLQAQGTGLPMRSDPGGEGRAGIALVGPDTAQPAEPSQSLGEKGAGSALLADMGWGHANPKQQAQCVHQNMTLASLGFFARVVAPFPGMVGRANGLAVEDGGGGLGPSPRFPADQTSQSVLNQFPQPLLPPAAETAIDGLPRAELLGAAVARHSRRAPSRTSRRGCAAARSEDDHRVGVWATKVRLLSTVRRSNRSDTFCFASVILPTPLGQRLSKVSFKTRSYPNEPPGTIGL